jgi:excisionase family DNA binding protein
MAILRRVAGPNGKEMSMELPDVYSKPTLTVEEVSSILGCSRSSAYEAVRRGDIPSLRIGRRYLIPTAKVRAMLVGSEPTPERVPVFEAAPGPGLLENMIDAIAEGVALGIQRANQRGAGQRV